MSKYDIQLRKLGMLLLPAFLRKSLLCAFVYTIVSPLENIYGRFMNFRLESLYRIKYNGQVCYLRAVLNDQFDPLQRRITITENPGANNSVVIVRDKNYNEPIPVRQPDKVEKVMYLRGVAGKYAYDFWVNIPTVLSETETAKLKSVVNTYKLASKRFNINYLQN
ncbi:MAG: hypothetical protein LUH10_00140 [Tannerellaceae bacterium]|nr:hypothetical protein [Tannerellaceae bacterium]